MDQFDSAIQEIYENYYYEEDVENVLEKIKGYKRFVIFGAGQLGQELVLTEEEVFVDCGGYTGDTSLQFIEKTKGRYKKLVIFEPEEYKENIIRETLKGYA